VNIKQIEAKARKLMRLNDKIWDKNKSRSGGEINNTIYRKELKKAKIKKMPYLYYYIFEDANYHALNKNLEALKKFTGTYSSAQKDFDEYTNKGGRTWNL